LTTATYTAALERWMLETHIPLTEPEHQILTALSRLTQPLHQSQLAEELNMSISGLSQHLTALAQRHALRLYHFINLPLIGITPYELLIQIPNPIVRQEIAELFIQFRYIWFINPIQQTRLHCRVLLPTKKAPEFRDWLNELAKKYNLAPIEPLRNTTVIQTWNFDIYIPNQGWPNDLTLPLHKMQTIFDDKYEDPISAPSVSTMSYKLLEQSEKYPIALKSEDFTYFLRAADIHQITDRITAQASKEIGRAGVSETAHMVYRRRIKQLEKLKVSQVQGIFLLHIGLDAVIQIYINENRFTVEQIVKGLSVLPHVVGLIFDNGNGHLVLFVPNENAVEIVSTLRKSFATNDIDAIIEVKPTWQSYSGFESPVKQKNYDIEKGEWKWERTTLPAISSK
jgi:DNA-binding Lrp family transcriptional regulator